MSFPRKSKKMLIRRNFKNRLHRKNVKKCRHHGQIYDRRCGQFLEIIYISYDNRSRVCFLSYLSPPLMNSPTLRSCNLLGRSSRSKCSIRSGSSWPRLPAEPLNCLVRRLEMLVKLEKHKSATLLNCF